MCERCSRAAEDLAQGSAVPTVTIHPTGERIHLEPEETILAGLYKAGYAYTVGCRRGGCAICKVDCQDGLFHYNRPIAATVITPEERTDGTCLSCRAVPDTDVTIQLREENLRLVNPLLRQINENARLRAEALARQHEEVAVPGAGRTIHPE